MRVFENVFIGIVDILGYSNLETSLKNFGGKASEAIITQMYNSLDLIIDGFRKNESIIWKRYGDGFVFYSNDSDIDNLSEMVMKNCRLLALSLSNSIPLRIAITQNTIHVDNARNGLTFSGQGWDVLRKIEKSLNWMGGFLYLPNYDGTHHETVRSLIQTTFLVKKQNSVPDVQFTPPFKDNLDFSTDKTWFLNWQKCLNQPKTQLDGCIINWWSQFAHGDMNNASEDVKEKQKNSIDFADYCRALHQASNLLYFSEIDTNIDIGAINGNC